MRLKALDRAVPLPVIMAFVCACASFTFCVLMAIIVLVAAWSQPVKAQEQEEVPACLASQAVFAKTMAETHHPLLFRFPPDLARRFISAWNVEADKLAVPFTADGVALYGIRNQDFVIISFFKKGCLVDAYNVPATVFWQVVGAADNSKWRI